MRVEHMREFVAIRDEGNFSRAARSLFMTQPALSRHVQEMERELGVRLLDRDRHSVTLTEAGERAYKAFRQVIRTYDRLTDDIAGYKAGLSGRHSQQPVRRRHPPLPTHPRRLRPGLPDHILGLPSLEWRMKNEK